MPHEESFHPPDWVKIADKDLDRVARLLADKDAEAAGFYLQQALEKLLKAFLLSRGWKLRRIHDLQALLNEALEFDGSLEKYRVVCQKITAFYFLDRYPLTTNLGVTQKDVRDSLKKVSGLIRKLKAHLTT
jgi:HEPN domain-containing protein